MWVFTKGGFISAVVNKDDDSIMHVRGRDRSSLADLADIAQQEIIQTPWADYPYRVNVSKYVFSKWLAAESIAVDYVNFKNEIKRTRGERFAHALMNVWHAMLAVEDMFAREPKKPINKGVSSGN